MLKWVFSFGAGHNEGRADMKNLLGGKGANLAEMASIGLPVPPGFTISTEVCTAYYENHREYPEGLKAQVTAALAGIEKAAGLRFSDKTHPLLVSVRSGARVSMPGMMDTVLNLGLNDQTVEGLAKAANDPRFAWDSYRRFIQMYGSVVLGVDHHRFEEIIDHAKLDANVIEDTALTAQHWRQGVEGYKDLVHQETSKPFPREHVLRRIHGECARRGRRRRNPHPAAAIFIGCQAGRHPARTGDARGIRGTAAGPCQAGSTL
jgi:pyruvate, orthophosphate dikinase